MALAGTGDANKLNGSLTIGAGATLSVTPSQPVTFNGAVTNAGTSVQATGGNIYFDGPELVGGTYVASGIHIWFGGAIDSPESEITLRAASASAGVFVFGAQSTLPGTGLPNFKSISVDGTLADIRFMPRASCEITNNLYDAVVAGANKVLIDSVENAAATVTVKNATWTPKGDFLLSSSNGRGSYLKIGEGGALNAASVSGKGLYFALGITSPMETILEVAEGGTLNYLGANNYFQIGRGNAASDANALPQRLVVSGGTVNMPTAQLLIGAYTRTGYADLKAGRLIVQQLQPRQTNVNIAYWKNAYDVRFTQTGGVLELGSGGSMSALPGVDKPYLDLEGGTLLATANLSNKYGYMHIQFGAGLVGRGVPDAPQYTIDLNGKTVDWNAPLAGASDVTITGEGAFNSTAALQSIPLGKWTVTNTADATSASLPAIDLSGAAGFAGGLAVAPGKSAKVTVAGEGLVEWAMLNSNQIVSMDALKAYTGVCPYVGTSLANVHAYYATEGSKPMGNKTRFIYRGQFYVDSDKAGTWYFAGTFDDCISLYIEDAEVFTSANVTAIGTGSVTLTEGWHDFRVLAYDVTGIFGARPSDWNAAGMAVGWSTDVAAEGLTAASAYTKFDTSTLAMRLPQGAVAQTAVRVRAATSGDTATYKNENLGYAALDCVTNSLGLLHTFAGDGVASYANSATLRYDGYFYMPEENVGSWAFTGQYDDMIYLTVDGVEVLEGTAHTVSGSGTANLSAGWHSFRISVTDGVGSYGGKLTDDNGKTCALRVKPANGAKTLAFDG